MSSSGAIPKGGARPKAEKGKEETEVTGDSLDHRYIVLSEQANQRRVPALHQHWVQRGTYIKYVPPPPCLLADGSPPPAGAREAWLEQMELLEEDLRNLMNLPHHKFWSQMVYDPTAHICLESFLKSCPRWYENHQLDELCQQMVDSLHRLVLLVYLRLGTPHESQSCHITPSVFGDIIYENFLFDVCQLLDLSVVYGPSCGPLLTRMFACLFRHQPKYYQDLSLTIASIVLALESVEDKLGVADYSVPVALDSGGEELPFSELQSVVFFLLDTFSSLQMFLALHPPAARCFVNEVYELRLSSFYERVIPSLMSQLGEHCQGSEWDPQLVGKINHTRSSMLATFRALLHHKCLAPLQEDKPAASVVGECVEKFLHLMSTCVAEKTFITDYCSAFPITPDLETFKHHRGDVTSLNFISEAITTVLQETSPGAAGVALALDHLPCSTPQEGQDSVDTSGMNGYAQESLASPAANLDVAAGVSSVQELLPDLGAGFITECLRYYNHCPEEVVNALLEDNLPPSLATLDRSAPLQPPSTPPPSLNYTQPEETKGDLLGERANVYDNDEFDVFSQPSVDRSKVHKGKRKTTTKTTQYQKDDTNVEKLKEIARQYEERGGTSIYEDEFRYEAEEDQYRPWDYEDEYDDTYDDNETGNIDDLGPEKVIKRRPGIIGAGRLNTQINYGNTTESSAENTDEEDTSQGTTESQQTLMAHQKGGKPQTSANTRALKGSTRGVQRIAPKKSSKPSKPPVSTLEKEAEEREEVHRGPSAAPPRPELAPFCENPEVVRQRAEQRRRDRDHHSHRGYRGQGGEQQQGWGEGAGRETGVTNGLDGERTGGPQRPRNPQMASKKSGKGWRHGEGDEDRGGYRGGKHKEDTNHGKAQSHQHRHKMIHKNEHKRQGAQAKFNRNN